MDRSPLDVGVTYSTDQWSIHWDLQKKNVAIVPYNPGWPKRFLEEKEHLIDMFASWTIEHLGSTAVPDQKT